MLDYDEIETSKEAWYSLRDAHPNLKICETYSSPRGDAFDPPGHARMTTYFGFEGCPIPLLGVVTTWTFKVMNPSKRLNVLDTYYLCIVR